MKVRLLVALAVSVAMSAIVGVGPATAAVEFGSGCAADKVTEGAIWVPTGHAPANPLPVTAPISGVITEWRVNSNLEAESEGDLPGEYPRIFQQRLLVLRAAGPESFTVVGEALGGILTLKGANAYAARLPVQAGDYLGVAGDPYALACVTEDEADTFGASVGGAPLGSTFKVQIAKGIEVPVTAKIEPDADADGYGDETQDRCPQSAAYQGACPLVQVSSLSFAGTKAATVYVTSSVSTLVTVSGRVKLGQRKGKVRRVTLTTDRQTVAPGALARFRLVFGKRLRRALRRLPRKRSLRLAITAGTGNLAAPPSVAKSALKLRGEARTLHRTRSHHRRAHRRRRARRRRPRAARPTGPPRVAPPAAATLRW